MSVMRIEEIQSLLPHRYPFLMVDRVLELELGKKIVAVKNVTVNEPQFSGHFPGRPIMPGVLMIEAMAQAAGLLVFKTEGAAPQGDLTYYLAGVDKTRFKRPVAPGDQLRIEIEILRCKRRVYVFNGACYVEDDLAAAAELMCTVR